jgi:hypothetical protein
MIDLLGRVKETGTSTFMIADLVRTVTGRGMNMGAGLPCVQQERFERSGNIKVSADS